MRRIKSPDTPWKRGRLDRRNLRPTLLFGRMYEDWEIEAGLFPAGARVFCIASAGCTALALAARGARVTAVDINPVQVDYLRERLAGAPPRAGLVDRLMGVGRRALAALGMRAEELRSFLSLANPSEQIRFWRERHDGLAWQIVLGFALHPIVLRTIYSRAFLQACPSRFAEVMRRRLERGWATHANRTNPYAWRLLLGCEPLGALPSLTPSLPLVLECADAAEYLERQPPASFDAFTLSNVLDAADAGYRERLLRAVGRAAAPGAHVVLRSFAESRDAHEDRRAASDRSLLWGRVSVRRAEALGDLA